MVENTVETATIVPTTQNSISTEKKVLEEVIPTEMSKPIQTLEPSKPSIKEGIVEISYEISSDELSKLFDGELEETIVIVVPECSPSCTASEIDQALGPASSTDGTWVGVLVGNTLYIHSGWNPIQGPWPGDIFRRLSKFDSDVTLCLGDLCYHMEDYVQLSRDQVGEGIYLSNFFKDIEETDLFVVTCDYGFSIGRGDYSPKILVHLKTINSE